MRTLVIGNQIEGYGTPFMEYGEVIHHPNPGVEDIAISDLICLIGGNDVDPSYYNHAKYKYTHSDPAVDQPCKFAFDVAIEQEIPIVGICKGAQQLCAFNGGALYQSVSGHHARHMMYVRGQEKPIPITSSHHQMMMLTDIENYELLGWADHLSDVYLSYPHQGMAEVKLHNGLPGDPEIVLFPHKQLAVQYHPEWMPRDSQGHTLFNQLIEEHLL